MPNIIIKKVGRSAAETARVMAKQMAREPHELLKTASAQVSKDSSIQEPPQQNDQDITGLKAEELSTDEEKKIKDQTRRRLIELEEELKQVRMKRKEQSEKWSQEQEKIMQKQEIPSEKPLIEPTTKPKRGQLGAAKKKQGTREMGKQVSG